MKTSFRNFLIDLLSIYYGKFTGNLILILKDSNRLILFFLNNLAFFVVHAQLTEAKR